MVVACLILLGIIYTIGTTAQAMLGVNAMPVESPTSRAQQDQAVAKALRPDMAANVQIILSRNFFGTIHSTPPQTPSQPKSVATKLPLVLHSVFFSAESERSNAIIAHQGKPGRMYRIGERLPGNAVLSEVLRDGVLIDREGVIESLRFPTTKGLAHATTDLHEADSAFSQNLELSGSYTDYDDAQVESEIRDLYKLKMALKSGEGSPH